MKGSLALISPLILSGFPRQVRERCCALREVLNKSAIISYQSQKTPYYSCILGLGHCIIASIFRGSISFFGHHMPKMPLFSTKTHTSLTLHTIHFSLARLRLSSSDEIFLWCPRVYQYVIYEHYYKLIQIRFKGFIHDIYECG